MGAGGGRRAPRVAREKLGAPGPSRPHTAAAGAPPRQDKGGAAVALAERSGLAAPRRAAPWAHGRPVPNGSEKEPPSPRRPGPGSAREVWAAPSPRRVSLSGVHK